MHNDFSYLDHEPQGLAANLAFDEAVIMHGMLDRPMARLWRVRERAVAVGFAGQVEQEVLLENCRRDGVPVVRRRSGGGSVVQGEETLNLSLYLPEAPASELGGVRRAHETLAGGLAEFLSRQGVAAKFYPPADVACAGRKLVGSAIWRVSAALLYQASLVVEPMVSVAERYLSLPKRQPQYRRGRGHASFMGSLRQCGLELGGEMLADALRRHYCCRGSAVKPGAATLARGKQLEREKYLNDEWNLRR